MSTTRPARRFSRSSTLLPCTGLVRLAAGVAIASSMMVASAGMLFAADTRYSDGTDTGLHAVSRHPKPQPSSGPSGQGDTHAIGPSGEHTPPSWQGEDENASLRQLTDDLLNQGGNGGAPNADFGGASLDVNHGESNLTPVPEPTSLILLGTGVAGVGVRRLRARRKQVRPDVVTEG